LIVLAKVIGVLVIAAVIGVGVYASAKAIRFSTHSKSEGDKD
jgi:ABC-type phosphate transport system auxiliary subunit